MPFKTAGGEGFGDMVVRDVFLLGAGFSKAISSAMPTMNDLAPKVLTNSGIDSRGWPKVAQTNIETALAYLMGRHPWLTESQYHRRLADALDLNARLATEIGGAEINAMRSQGKCPTWLVKLAFWMHDNQAGIISLNYDTLLERAFQHIPIAEDETGSHSHFLDPRALYPITLDGDYADQHVWSNWCTAYFTKLHGSTNWYYSGAREAFGEVLRYRPTRGWCPYQTDDKLRDKVPLIVPPISDKVGHLSHESVSLLWRSAKNYLNVPTRVFCIGYSFPETDLPVRFLLSDSCLSSDLEFVLIDVDESMKSKVEAIVPQRFRLNTEIFGYDWPEKLVEYLSKEPRKENFSSQQRPILNALVERTKRTLPVGSQLQVGGPENELFFVDSVGDDRLVLRSKVNEVSLELTWSALSSVVEHVRSKCSAQTPLRVMRCTPNLHVTSVERLLSTYYYRSFGRAVASVLSKSDVIRMPGPRFIAGLHPSFARELEADGTNLGDVSS